VLTQAKRSFLLRIAPKRRFSAAGSQHRIGKQASSGVKRPNQTLTSAKHGFIHLFRCKHSNPFPMGTSNNGRRATDFQSFGRERLLDRLNEEVFQRYAAKRCPDFHLRQQFIRKFYSRAHKPVFYCLRLCQRQRQECSQRPEESLPVITRIMAAKAWTAF
jgi:hypothetical protein